jgi:two-component system sensor histidine kinase UhpB
MGLIRTGASEPDGPRPVPLFWRTFALNAAVLIGAGLVLVLSPATVSSPVSLGEATVLAAGTAVMLVLNLVLLRRAFAPLERLAAAMGEVDLLERRRREIPVGEGSAEVVQLATAFDAMLDRLEEERRRSTRVILAAQEEERARIARELHDEVGQGLTAALLHLERASWGAAEDNGSLAEAREAVRASLEDVRGITLRLRPEALDDLGLRAALIALSDRVKDGAAIEIALELPNAFPQLDADQELVLYRVAQEALTNVVRHADAAHARLALAETDEALLLSVEDDGHGLGREALPGAGLQGMRERALLVGGSLQLGESMHGGALVNLVIPK